MELVADTFLLHVANKHQFNELMMCSLFNNLSTVAGNNNTMCSTNSIGNRNLLSGLSISVVYLMKLNKTRLPCLQNSDQNFTQNYARGVRAVSCIGVYGVSGCGGLRVVGC